MEKLYQNIIKGIQSIVSLLKIMLRSSLFIKSYQTTSEEIYVLGNGPSIKTITEVQLNLLKHKNLLAVNGFSLSPLFKTLKPKYYLTTSPGFYNYEAIDYNVEVRKNIIKTLVEDTTWPLLFFLPIQSKKNQVFTNLIESNQQIKIQYFNTTPIEGITAINHFFYKKGWGTPRPHNVIIPSIHQAINAGYKNIKILGAEHSWLPYLTVNQDNEVLLNQKHFYDEKTSTPKQMHKNEGRGQRQLHEVLEKFYYTFRSYHELNSYAKAQEVEILNLTPNSFVDAFKKETLDQHLTK